jgi:hypothetical protein
LSTGVQGKVRTAKRVVMKIEAKRQVTMGINKEVLKEGSRIRYAKKVALRRQEDIKQNVLRKGLYDIGKVHLQSVTRRLS